MISWRGLDNINPKRASFLKYTIKVEKGLFCHFRLQLPNVRTSHVRLTDGELSGHTLIQRISEASCDETPEKITIGAQVVANDIIVKYSWKRNNIR